MKLGTIAGLSVAAVLAWSGFAQAAEYTIRLSHGMPETMQSGQHAWAIVFKEFVETRSGGKIEVRILGANAAGDERQQLDQVQTGVNQMALVSEIVQPSFFEPALIFGIPFLFSSSAVAWEVLDGPFGERYNQAFLEATGVRFLGHIESGFRSFFTRDKEVHSPADLAGLKIRTGENPIHIEMVRALGANPTPISWTEVYTSLQQGVVDGMENPPGLFYSMKFYEHQKYLTVDRHLYSIHSAIINEEFYRSLPEDIRGVVNEGADLATTIGRSSAFLAERAAIDQLKEAGLTVYEPTAAEYEEFRKLGRPSAEALVREKLGAEWVDALLAAVTEAETKLRAE